MKKLIFLTLLTLFAGLSLISDTAAQTRGWGYNETGVLGLGNSTNQPTPQTVSALPDATGIGSGIDHTLFLRANGTLAVAGRNDFGQFGDNLVSAGSSSPIAVPGLTNVVSAQSGGFHVTALLSDGTTWSWGYNGEGQIGNGTTTTTGCFCVPAPTQVAITDVVQIEAGSFHTLALKSNGTVWAWGLNDDGELGDNSTTNRSTPVQVGSGVSGFTNIIAIAAGDNHSLALKSDGTVWVWGSNEFAQIGNGAASMTDQLVPVKNATLLNVTQIAAGVFHSMAQDKTGKVFVWGDNFYGQVGNGSDSDIPQTVPVQNTTLANVIEIDTAGFTNYARLADGSVRAWGANDGGEIGNGTTNGAGCLCQPTPVQTAVGAGNAAISAGWFHAFALKPVIAVGAGANQTLRGDNVQLTFANLTGAGDVAYTAVSAAAVAASYTLPLGYTIQANQPAYDVTTTATTAGDIDVCIANVNEFSPTAFAGLRILHGEGANWVDRTFSADFIRRRLCARVSSLSPFVIATAPAPTAANVYVTGRVTNGKRGLVRAIVSVTDSSGTTRMAHTTSFGYYRFEGLPAGQTYVFNVTAKHYQFAPQVVVLNDNLADFDFIAIE
jgi:alpha-tubulin suppressor-like RCC1 family protein